MNHTAWNRGFDACMAGKTAPSSEDAAWTEGWWVAAHYRAAIHTRPANPRDSAIADIMEFTGQAAR